MRNMYAVLMFALVLSVFACEKKPDVPPPPQAPEEQPATEAQPRKEPESAAQIVDDYASGLVSTVDRAKTGQAKTDLGAVQEAIRNFQVENGRYPDSLEAIRGFLQIKTDLGMYNYDVATGTVTLK